MHGYQIFIPATMCFQWEITGFVHAWRPQAAAAAADSAPVLSSFAAKTDMLRGTMGKKNSLKKRKGERRDFQINCPFWTFLLNYTILTLQKSPHTNPYSDLA